MMPSALVNQQMRKNSSMGFQFRTYSCSLDKKVIKMDPHLQNTLPVMSRSGERVHQRGCGNMEVVCNKDFPMPCIGVVTKQTNVNTRKYIHYQSLYVHIRRK